MTNNYAYGMKIIQEKYYHKKKVELHHDIKSWINVRKNLNSGLTDQFASVIVGHLMQTTRRNGQF